MENHLRFLFFTRYFLGLFVLAMLHHLFAARLPLFCGHKGSSQKELWLSSAALHHFFLIIIFRSVYKLNLNYYSSHVF